MRQPSCTGSTCVSPHHLHRSGARRAALALVALLALPAAAAGARAPGVDGPEGAKLTATLLGALAPGERAQLAVKWTGEPGERITVWYDADGDGTFADSEVVLPNAPLTEPIQVLEFEPPSWSTAGRRGAVRITTQDSGTTIVVQSSSSTPDCAFQPGFEIEGLNNVVFALAVYDDGTGPALYAGGGFTTAGGISANEIAKWDGTSWSALGSPTNGVNGTARALAVYDDGTGPALYVGGDFTTAGGISANRVAKWDGTSWSALGSPTNGVDGGVQALAVYDDGTGSALFVGGHFTTAGGISASRIAKWDGTSWSALGSPTDGVDNGVYALAVYDDGTDPALFVGGQFTTAGGISASRIAKWDGTSWSALGSPTNGVNGRLFILAVYNDGTGPALYAGGEFTTSGGIPANRIAKWDGTSWSALGSPTNGVNSDVWALAVYDDGTGPALYAGGVFTTAGGISANHIARWDGTSWSALGSPTNGVNSNVFALAVYDDGTGPALYVGGDLTTAGGISASRIAKWDGTSWSVLGGPSNGMNSPVVDLAVYDDGTGPALYAGGSFTTAGGISSNNIAKWDGTSWSALGSPTNGVNSTVFALAVYDDGTGPALYAGGDFTTAGGISANHVAKWDGTSWSALGSPTNGVNSRVLALAVYDDGTGPALYVGGELTTAGGISASRIAKWDGTSWSALGSPTNGMDSAVQALAVYDDGTGPALYAGGNFTTAGGISASRIAKWDGTSWSALGSPTNGVNSTVRALAVYDDGTGPALYVGGDFTTAGGISASRIAKWDGTSWSAQGSPTNGVNSGVWALAVYDDGTGPALYVGGDFTTAGGISADRIAKWDGTSWSAQGSPTNGVNSTVQALAVYDDGTGPALYAGGNFTTAGGISSNHIAKWSCSCACDYALSAEQWRMIALPCKAATPTVSAVFGDDLAPGDYGSRWILYRRNVATSSYEALGLNTEMTQGRGYWIKSLDAATLDVSGGMAPTLCPAASRYSSCFDIALTGSGGGLQNLSGHPFSSLVDWADVRFVSGGMEYTPAEAQTAGLASKIVYKWNGGAYEPYDGETPGMEGALDDWDGVWVKALTDLTLRVPTATAVAKGETLVAASSTSEPEPSAFTTSSSRLSTSSTGNGKGKGGGPPEESLTGWYVRIVAEGGGLTDRGNVLGQLSTAADGLDAHDLPELPPFSTPYLTVVFPHPEWGETIPQYASDYRKLVKGYVGTWDFEVRSDDPSRAVTLSFDGPGYILKKATLTDLATGQRIALQKTKSYSFTLTGTTRAFRFEVAR
jgi:trimeric autotransporter adhesin